MRSRFLRGAGIALLCLFGATVSHAQNVVLSAKTGDLNVEGKLLEFDGEFYTVETKFGPLTVDARTVVCDGEGCPSAQDSVAKFTVAADGVLADALLEAFALYQGAEVSLNQDTQTLVVESEASGVLAEISLVAGGDDPYATIKGDEDVLVIADTPAPDASRTKVIGMDAVVIAKSDVNPVEAISMEQVRGVLNGTIRNWKDLGGGDSEIALHVASGGAGFDARLAALGLIPADGVAVRRHGRMKDLADEVANDPFGLAIVPYSALRTAVPMALRGSCGMHNVPEVFTLQSGSYPMSHAISVARPAKRLPLFAREFLEFLDTEQAQAVVADLGFADMGIATRGLNGQGQRLANSLMIIGKEVPLKDVREMTTIMSGAKRLSATFRFRPGSTRLDAQSRENANALAAGLILGNYADKIVYLMGFSDGDGRARQNKALSKDRAEAVRQALIKAAPDGSLADVEFEVVGYGEASPLVCEDTPADAQINRRVEVWVKDRS